MDVNMRQATRIDQMRNILWYSVEHIRTNELSPIPLLKTVSIICGHFQWGSYYTFRCTDAPLTSRYILLFPIPIDEGFVCVLQSRQEYNYFVSCVKRRHSSPTFDSKRSIAVVVIVVIWSANVDVSVCSNFRGYYFQLAVRMYCAQYFVQFHIFLAAHTYTHPSEFAFNIFIHETWNECMKNIFIV